jgi:hypothetical protein
MLEVHAEVVDDVLGSLVLAACAVLEVAILFDRRAGSLLDWPVTWEDRARLLEAARGVSALAANALGDPPPSRWRLGAGSWDLSSLEAACAPPRRRSRWWR